MKSTFLRLIFSVLLSAKASFAVKIQEKQLDFVIAENSSGDFKNVEENNNIRINRSK